MGLGGYIISTALSFFAIAGKCNYGFFLPFPPPFALFCVEMQCLLNVKVFREEKACRGNIGGKIRLECKGCTAQSYGLGPQRKSKCRAALQRGGSGYYRGSPHFTPVLQILDMKTGQPVWAAPGRQWVCCRKDWSGSNDSTIFAAQM